ncbi:MAG: PQQ-dependent sugar dehydrogenase [Pirellulales bacterium]|nr:PQQ-dependent sugar dehydrogenase [Pirellulales bacterium]
MTQLSSRIGAGFVATCAAMVALSPAKTLFAAYAVERLVTGLNQPMYVTQAPGDNSSLYIVERREGTNTLGRVQKYDLQTQSITTFLDLSGTVNSDGGLLAMEFRPDFETSGYFYVTLNDSGVNRLEEYRVVDGAPVFQRRLLQYNNLANVFHTINQPLFQPGGSSTELYLTTGDGGTQADQGAFNPALIESPNSIYGKVLRFDLNASYPVPAVDATHAGVSVVALGIRNPYRSSFDRETGDFYFGDVGFNAAEEVNFIPAGHFANPAAPPLDFGWTSREGTIATPGSSAGGPGSPGDLNPVFEYSHGPHIVLPHPSALYGTSITGGYVYRGPEAELQGRYFFSDFVNGNVYSGTFDPNTPPAAYNGANMTGIENHTVQFETLAGGSSDIRFVTSFGEDNAGNLYIVKFGNSFFPANGQGEIYRVIPAVALDAVVNRSTGAITLTNNTGAPLSLKSLSLASSVGAIQRSALTPITGFYDAEGDGSVDDVNAWIVTSPAGSYSLFAEASTGDPGTLDAGQQIVLSPASGWIRSPVEDLALSITDAADAVVNATVTYVGNGGNPFVRSDLNFDGALTVADWEIFVANAGATFAGLSTAASYGFGDLNGDGENGYADFQLFKADYVAVHGEAAFAALRAVPEPATAGLLLISGFAGARRRQAAAPRRTPTGEHRSRPLPLASDTN